MTKNHPDCFGVAYDSTVKECQICGIRSDCSNAGEPVNEEAVKPESPNNKKVVDFKKAKGNKAETKKEEEEQKTEARKAEPPKQKEKSKKVDTKKAGDTNTSKKSDSSKKKDTPKPKASGGEGMPDFKPMSIEELEKIGAERGLDIKDFQKKYPENRIYRMRLTMSIKATY
jgi:hypothetical protein